MSARFRWLSLKPLGRVQLSKIASAMQAKPYVRGVTSGYGLATIRADWIEGTFTERLEYIEKLSDPLGGELSVSRVEFRRTDFRIGTAYPQLEFKNPARQVRPVINLIAESLDFQIAVEPLSVSPFAWAKELAKLGEPVQVLGIRSAKFSLSNEVQASVVVTGTSDVRGLMPTLIGKRTIEADSIVCAWRAEGGDWQVELKDSGCANVIVTPVENPGNLLRKALAGLP